MDIRKTLGRNLAALIKAKGYRSAELFAHEHDIPKSWVYRILRGEADIRLSGLLRLARSLDVTLDELYPMKRKWK